jgi:hypothetical protein
MDGRTASDIDGYQGSHDPRRDDEPQGLAHVIAGGKGICTNPLAREYHRYVLRDRPFLLA